MSSPGRSIMTTKAEYLYYLGSSAWKAVKQRYMDSKMPKHCYVCKEAYKRDFHFHHRTYKNLGCERLMDITPICADCHKAIHDVHNVAKRDVWGATSSVKNRYAKIYRNYNLNKQEILKEVIKQLTWSKLRREIRLPDKWRHTKLKEDGYFINPVLAGRPTIPKSKLRKKKIEWPFHPEPVHKPKTLPIAVQRHLQVLRLPQIITKVKYRSYLHSDAWKYVRHLYMEKYSTNCFVCDEPTTKRREFHHLTYARLGKEELEDLVLVCSKCHGAIHSLHRNKTKIIESLSLKTITFGVQNIYINCREIDPKMHKDTILKKIKSLPTSILSEQERYLCLTTYYYRNVNSKENKQVKSRLDRLLSKRR